jgi:hypothetical protein
LKLGWLQTAAVGEMLEQIADRRRLDRWHSSEGQWPYPFFAIGDGQGYLVGDSRRGRSLLIFVDRDLAAAYIKQHAICDARPLSIRDAEEFRVVLRRVRRRATHAFLYVTLKPPLHDQRALSDLLDEVEALCPL